MQRKWPCRYFRHSDFFCHLFASTVQNRVRQTKLCFRYPNSNQKTTTAFQCFGHKSFCFKMQVESATCFSQTENTFQTTYLTLFFVVFDKSTFLSSLIVWMFCPRNEGATDSYGSDLVSGMNGHSHYFASQHLL